MPFKYKLSYFEVYTWETFEPRAPDPSVPFWEEAVCAIFWTLDKLAILTAYCTFSWRYIKECTAPPLFERRIAIVIVKERQLSHTRRRLSVFSLNLSCGFHAPIILAFFFPEEIFVCKDMQQKYKNSAILVVYSHKSEPEGPVQFEVFNENIFVWFLNIFALQANSFLLTTPNSKWSTAMSISKGNHQTATTAHTLDKRRNIRTLWRNPLCTRKRISFERMGSARRFGHFRSLLDQGMNSY